MACFEERYMTTRKNTGRRWFRFETLRPGQAREVVRESPALYWPLGLIEHHGRHLPVGFDGIKAERLCVRVAERTGGLVLPVMWWGGGGGHREFAWTFYQDPEASRRIVGDTLDRACLMGFRAIVIVAGHYPWDQVLEPVIPPLREKHRRVLFLAGSEPLLGKTLGVKVPGDHAARWETSYGLALLPEFVDLGALDGDDRSADWPDPQRLPDPKPYPKLHLDPADPLFSLYGEDPRGAASAEEGERQLAPLIEAIAARIESHLSAAGQDASVTNGKTRGSES
jgi:creatinine amidohydrolase